MTSHFKDSPMEDSIEWLVSNAENLAAAKSELTYMEEYRKTIEAMLMGEARADSMAARKMHALASPRYVEHLAKIRQAVFKYEKLRHEAEGHKARIDVWRTTQATLRSAGV